MAQSRRWAGCLPRPARVAGRGLLAAALTVCGLGAAQAQPTGLLNDTGQTQCYDGSNMVACSAANTGDNATYPRQDGRFGRDPAAAAGMPKTGGGAAGFDFTRLCWNGAPEGSANCTGTLVANGSASAAAATPSTDWACTQDNVTKLVWSLQTIGDGVNNINWADATSTASGSPIATHNANGRCGYTSGWRVPTRRELLSIVHYGAASTSIDGNYFPGTAPDIYWTSDVFTTNSNGAWIVVFNNGNSYADDKTNPKRVRLVRSGP